MEHRVDVEIGFSWAIQCSDTCTDESWEIDGGTHDRFEIYVPVFTPIHPRVGKYTTVLNPAYNLLIKPAISGALEKVAGAADLFFGSSASEICKQFSQSKNK